ncbi:MAG: Uma2 family endonuclease [Acidobacteria bacterium]|nr:Uma2 family endonuclease [Acidobacteriota bacterium]
MAVNRPLIWLIWQRGGTKSMSLLQSQLSYTVEEYLALERASEERHEYLDGQIYAMAGESEQHGDICVNLVGELRAQLRGGPCRVWTKDTKVRSGPTPKPYQTRKGLFSYPDAVVVCGGRQYHDEHRDVLLNPTVIIEVLSPSTEAYDRGEKFRRYRTYLGSLTDYVLVSQSLPLIEHYRRQPNDEWIMASAGDLNGSLHLASINCTLRLAEVYDRISFPTASEQES